LKQYYNIGLFINLLYSILFGAMKIVASLVVDLRIINWKLSCQSDESSSSALVIEFIMMLQLIL